MEDVTPHVSGLAPALRLHDFAIQEVAVESEAAQHAVAQAGLRQVLGCALALAGLLLFAELNAAAVAQVAAYCVVRWAEVRVQQLIRGTTTAHGILRPGF